MSAKNGLHVTLLFLIMVFANSVFANSSQPHSCSKPKLLFHQDAQAKPLNGSIDLLKTSIREGNKIRLYMKLRTVEHLMDTGFLTIFEGHVFAQISHIQGQRPNRETGNIELRDNQHVGLYSTKSPYEMKWFELQC